MATKDNRAENAARSAAQPIRRSRLAMPYELPAFAGVQHADERHAQGVVKTEDIPGLLGTVGISGQEHLSIPFQRILKSRGDQFELRIENAAGHVVDGTPIVGHQCKYRQTLPERTA